MKRVVSYSWFRNENSWSESPNTGEARGRVFGNYLRVIVRGHLLIWGGYDLEIAHDDRVMEQPYFKALKIMESEGILKLRFFGKSETLCGRGGMMERMHPAFDPDVDYCICRDIDSIPCPRDRRAVEEFIESGHAVHVLHDNESHAGVMGGTTSVNTKKFKKLIKCDTFDAMMSVGSFAEGYSWMQHGGDQHFLARNLLPLFYKDTLVHELHHITDVPSADIRTSIGGPMPIDIPSSVAEVGDSFAFSIGGCADVEKPFAYFDALTLSSMDKVREIEKKAGCYAGTK